MYVRYYDVHRVRWTKRHLYPYFTSVSILSQYICSLRNQFFDDQFCVVYQLVMCVFLPIVSICKLFIYIGWNLNSRLRNSGRCDGFVDVRVEVNQLVIPGCVWGVDFLLHVIQCAVTYKNKKGLSPLRQSLFELKTR